MKVIPIVPVGPEEAGNGLYASEKKVYPRAVTGAFAQWRWAFVWLTQVFFYGLPWLNWGERQAVLFDLAARRFYILGYVLYPQDFIYLTGLLVVSALSLFLFTAVAGRLWCGFACPQTVYTEMFLWIERKVEGERNARIRLDGAAFSAEKLVKKWFKHLLWGLLAMWTGFSFVGYFTPIHDLGMEFLQTRMGSWEVFWVFFYAFATYGNAGFMREQVCKYMCPYARFQSAMFDRNTMIVSYDPQRGEPRGSRGRKVDPKAAGLGDCINCGLCVQVCPTGIDIREGLQYQCISCAACVDVCDEVMDKMSYPRGLIRFATQNGLVNRWNRSQTLKRVLRPRVLLYSGVLVLLCIGFVVSLAVRDPFRVDVVRDRGTLARLVGEGQIENVYRLQVMNATESSQRYRVLLDGLPGAVLSSTPDFEVGPAQARWLPVSVQIPPTNVRELGPGAHPIRFRVERIAQGDEAPAAVQEKSTFVVPR